MALWATTALLMMGMASPSVRALLFAADASARERTQCWRRATGMSFITCFTSSDMNQEFGSAGLAVELRMAEEQAQAHAVEAAHALAARTCQRSRVRSTLTALEAGDQLYTTGSYESCRKL